MVKSKPTLHMLDHLDECIIRHGVAEPRCASLMGPKDVKGQRRFHSLQGLMLFEKRDTSDPGERPPSSLTPSCLASHTPCQGPEKEWEQLGALMDSDYDHMEPSRRRWNLAKPRKMGGRN